jgi:hypothetical protein
MTECSIKDSEERKEVISKLWKQELNRSSL